MVRLDCSGVIFGSQLDENYMFTWALEIAGVVRWEKNALVVRSHRVSATSLRELLALFRRYGIPMDQLAQFRNAKNEIWFANPKSYWYQSVFGKSPKRAFLK